MTVARALAITVIAATLTSCSPTDEAMLLSRFFAASRLRDRTLLQTFATVSFEPNVQGIITRFEITNITERQGEAVVSKDVSISAPVQLPDGRTARKNFVVTMQRPRPGHDPGMTTAGWTITAITDATAAASSPRS